ncbi:MAG: hypothetical protein RSB41_00985 [Bacilli bacterium]
MNNYIEKKIEYLINNKLYEDGVISSKVFNIIRDLLLKELEDIS